MNFEQAAEALRQSWETHRQAFGPILEPAFAENPQVRIILTNALNHISRRDIKRGMELLKEIQPHCIYDEDKAAWAFFVGLCFEMAGAKALMELWYKNSCEIGHRFYLPYLKLAKAAHSSSRLDEAAKYYECAIECLLDTPEIDSGGVILGSALTNLCSCLTMLHRYGEAEQVWAAAQQYPAQPGADATGAILYAAMGKAEKSEEYLQKLEAKHPTLALQTREMTRQILEGTHPAFSE